LFTINTWQSWRTWGISGGMIPWDQGYTIVANPKQDKTTKAPFVPGHRGRYAPRLSLRAAAPFEPPYGTLRATE
jgi:beta-galactosidase